MRTHEYFAGINAAEKYVLRNLLESDEILFEEHMLQCETCTEDVRKLRNTSNLLEESILIPGLDVPLPKQDINENIRNIGIYLKIAAGVAILATLSWFAFWYFNRTGQNEQLIAGKKELNPVQTTLPINKDTIQNKKLIAENSNAEIYKQLAFFESQINEVYRSESVTDVVPSNDVNFKTVDIIEFRWKKQFIGKLTLTIYNNDGKIIFQNELENDSFSKKIKIPGLYYWQLETDKDILYTGKFKVK